MVAAAVPVKTLALAKERLSELLSPAERKRLSLAMLFDVLDALRATPELSGVFVVTADVELSGILRARRAGVHLVREPEPGGLNAAVRHAACSLAERGVEGMLVVPADLPLITPRVLSGLIRASQGVSVAVVPDREGQGTSLLFVSPPAAIPPRFGAGSRAAHLEEARSAKLSFSLLPPGPPTWDVDCPADLTAVLRYGYGTRTRAELCEAGIDTRLRRRQDPRGID